MKGEDKNPRPPTPFIADGSQDAAVIVAINDQYRRAQQAAMRAGGTNPPMVPAPPPFIARDSSVDAALIAAWEAHRRQAFVAATTGTTGPVHVPEDEFPVFVSQTVVIPYDKTFEGELIRAQTIPLIAILKKIMEAPARMYDVDPRKWEEIIAATYDQSGLFDEVTLTPRSGDLGRDVIAVKKGFGSVRLIESVKRYKPGHVVSADEVRALLGVLLSDQKATKGVVSTTWEFAPKIAEDMFIKPHVPYRLELVNGTALVARLNKYANRQTK